MWWLPIATMLVAAVANQQAQKKVDKERDLKSQLETQRQSGIGKEVMARMQQELSNQSRPEQEAKLEQAAQVRERAYTPKDVSTDSYVVNPSAPTEVRSEMAGRMVDALKRGREDAKSLAKLGARSDVAFGNNVSLAESAADLNQLGGFSRGSSAVLPYELQGANAKGKNWRTVADVANAVGMASMFYNMGPAAGAAKAAGPEAAEYINMHRAATAPY